MAGSIEKRGENKYRLVVAGGITVDGKRKKYYKTITATNTRAAEKELAKFITEIEKNDYIQPSKLTFSAFIDIWIDKYGEQNLRPETLRRYKDILNRHIKESLGHIKLEKIKPPHLLEFYKILQEDGSRSDGKEGGLAPRTIRQYHRIISSILETAVQWQFIASNPAKRVKSPKIDNKATVYFTEKDIDAIFKALEEEEFRYRVFVQLAFATGLRRGELMALEWTDIDLEQKTLRVSKSLQHVPGKGLVTTEPKTEKSNRLVPIPASIITMLKEYIVQQRENQIIFAEMWGHSKRLITTPEGNDMLPASISQWWRRFLRRHNLPYLRFHGIRHTTATLLIGQGVHAKTISTVLGHSNISTTMDIYAHSLQTVQQEAAEKMDEILRKHQG